MFAGDRIVLFQLKFALYRFPIFARVIGVAFALSFFVPDGD